MEIGAHAGNKHKVRSSMESLGLLLDKTDEAMNTNSDSVSCSERSIQKQHPPKITLGKILTMARMQKFE